MSISDNARERARIARLKALESEQQVQNFGEVGDSRVVVINYDPDKKAYLVRTLGGQIGYAMNISGTQLGVGATVQATRKGNGFIIDYFDQSTGKGTGNSNDKGSDLSKDAFNNTSTGGIFTVSEGEDVYIAGPNGECTLANFAVGKAPSGSFKTLKECREAQDSEYNCEAGVCKPVPKGTGKYKSKAECEKGLVYLAAGGGCPVAYYVEYDIEYISHAFLGGGPYGFGHSNSSPTSYMGPITLTVQPTVNGGKRYFIGNTPITEAENRYPYYGVTPKNITFVPVNPSDPGLTPACIGIDQKGCP